MKKILLFIILFSTIGFSQIVRQPMLSDSLRAAEAAVALEVADLVTVDDSLASDVVDLIAVDDSLASDISDAGTIQDSLVLDIADLVTVDDSLASDISDVITIQDSLVLDIADLVTVDDSLASDIAALPTVAETQAIVSDSIAGKLDENFSGLTTYTGTTGEADAIPYMAEGDGTTYKLEVADLPISTAVSASQAAQDVTTETILEDYATNARATAIEANDSEQDSIITTLLARVLALENIVGGTIITPDPHTELTATGGDNKVDLSWTETTDEYDSTWIKYKLPSVSTWTYLAKVDSATLVYEHSSLGNGITYDYAVYAIEDGNIGGISNIATATTNTPIGEEGGLFLADAEENNLDEWTGTAVDGATISIAVSDTSELHGNYGFISIQDSTLESYAYGYHTLETAQDSLWMRFYFTLRDTMEVNATGGFAIARMYNSTTAINNTGISLCPASIGDTVSLIKSFATDVTPVGWLTDDTTLVEVFYKKGTGADGITRVYINGELEREVTNSADTLQVTGVRFGLVSLAERITNDGWIKFDDCALDLTRTGTYDTTQSESDDAWFVNNTATGLNSGESWTDAWESFADIIWDSVAVGDTIYISGGSVSKTYNAQLTIGKSGSSGNPIVITKGLTSGHDGEVIIDGEDTRPYGIFSTGKQYISIENLTVMDGADNAIRIYTGSHNTSIKDCKIKNSLGTQGLLIWLSSDITIDGNYFWNDEDNGSHIDNDLITFNGGITSTTVCTTLVISDNEFHNYSTTDTDHSDIIQGYLYADVEICRNLMVNHNHKAGGETSNQSGLYFNRTKGNWKIHNNVIIDRDTVNINGKINVIESNEVRSDLDSVFIYNNSLLLFGSQKGISVNAQYDPSSNGVYADIRNNAIYKAKTGILIDVNTGAKGLTALIDYNIGELGNYYVNGTKTFAQMQTAGYQTNGLDEYPEYTSVVSGSEDLNPDVSANLIGAGVLIGSPYNIDVIGETHNNPPEVGAYKD